MGFWGRVNQNSAAALTVGGTVLALGIALGAVGLAEISRTESPWANLWVRVGSGIGLLALAWILTVSFESRCARPSSGTGLWVRWAAQ